MATGNNQEEEEYDEEEDVASDAREIRIKKKQEVLNKASQKQIKATCSD